MTTPANADVVVVGAGFAGLSAARDLVRLGHDVVVLEGRDRVGGRSSTTTIAGTPVDLGGTFVGPTQDAVIASEYGITQSAVSQHLSILENAGLVASEKRGQYVHYRLIEDNLVNTLNSYVQEVCPVSKPIKRESADLAARKARAEEDE